jgi:hypothetical protein
MRQNIRQLRRPANAAGRRVRANWPAAVKAGDTRAACRVIDISADGARVTASDGLNLETSVWLVMDHVPPVKGVVVWRDKNCIGVRFRDQQDWVQDDFKNRFDPAGWLPSEQSPQ